MAGSVHDAFITEDLVLHWAATHMWTAVRQLYICMVRFKNARHRLAKCKRAHIHVPNNWAMPLSADYQQQSTAIQAMSTCITLDLLEAVMLVL